MLNLTPRYTGTLPADLPKSLTPVYQQSPTLARLFAARGIDSSDEIEYSLSRLLAASGLRDIDIAIALLDKAIDEQQHILIVGDFDCDGATSTALMMKVLGDMGAKVNFLVPDRFKYGYGLTPEIVQLGIQQYQPDMIVTVDNGISSHEGVATAKKHGISVIITDHHLTTKPKPKADAVVNPNQLGCDFASKALVGVGVAFYLLGRLAKQRREQQKTTAKVSQYLDLVALGTIADVGVLDYNNRTLVHHGLQAIRQGQCSLGILAILEQAGRDYKKITVQDFGFVIGPRINAAGRMDTMRIGIDCLMTEDLNEAQQLAYELDSLNKQRRRVEGDMREQADFILNEIIETNSLVVDERAAVDSNNSELTRQSSKPRSIALYQDDWHQGVIGIVAGRLKETYYCPAIVFAPADIDKVGESDAIKGSARSIPGVHIRDAIEHIAQAKPHLITHFGGHAMAAGLTLKRQDYAEFSQDFEQLMRSMDDDIFEEEQFTDGQLIAQDFSLAFADTINNSQIWGHGFVPPQFDGVFEVISFKVLKDKHLKLSLNYPNVQYPIDAIWFNYSEDKWDYKAKQVHVLFELDINEWNGRQNIQLMVKDLAMIDED